MLQGYDMAKSKVITGQHWPMGNKIQTMPFMCMVQSVADSKRRFTLIIVEEFHVEADVIRQRAEMLHQHVKFAHQQRTGFLGVVTGHFSQALAAFAENRYSFSQEETLICGSK